MEVLTGCGGWGYFNVPGDRLRAYSQAYDFVEVNSTFYETPDIEQVRSWRMRARKELEFTVKCSSELTHTLRLRPEPRSYKVLDQMLLICRELGSKMLVLQTPPDLATPPAQIKELFSSFEPGPVRIAWEPRGDRKNTYMELARDLGFVPSVDVAVEDAPTEDIVYTRVFGPGKARAKDLSERTLKEIEEKTSSSGAKKAYVTFHGSRMYKDAARFLIYRKNGDIHH